MFLGINLEELKFKVPFVGKTSIAPPFVCPMSGSLRLKLQECSGCAEFKMRIELLFR